VRLTLPFVAVAAASSAAVAAPSLAARVARVALLLAARAAVSAARVVTRVAAVAGRRAPPRLALVGVAVVIARRRAVPLTPSAMLARDPPRAPRCLSLGLGSDLDLPPPPPSLLAAFLARRLHSDLLTTLSKYTVWRLSALLDVAVRVGVLLGDGGEVLGQPLLIGISGLTDGIGTVHVERALEVD